MAPPKLRAVALVAVCVLVPAGLATMKGLAHAAPRERFTLAFTPTAGRTPWSCGTNESLPGATLTDLRLFVHNVRTVDAHGVEHAVALDTSSAFATKRIALLDFPGSTTACRDRERSGSTSLAFELPSSVDASVAAVKLTIGIPFDENHANPALAQGPLAVGAMNWGWQAGYKFWKLEGAVAGGPFRVHIGETGCLGRFANVSSCSRPNRAEVMLMGPFRAKGRVRVDLAPFFKGAESAASRNCMGDPDATCAVALRTLGIDAESGAAAFEQQLFTVEAQ